jgi:hypothetical protein
LNEARYDLVRIIRPCEAYLWARST